MRPKSADHRKAEAEAATRWEAEAKADSKAEAEAASVGGRREKRGAGDVRRPVHAVPRTPAPGTEFLFDATEDAPTGPTPPPSPFPEYYPCNAFEVLTTSGQCGHCSDYMCDRVSLHVKDLPKACRVCSYCIQHTDCDEYTVKLEHKHRDHQPSPDLDYEQDDDLLSDAAATEGSSGSEAYEYPGNPIDVHLPSTSFAMSAIDIKDTVDTSTPALLIEALNELEHARHSEHLRKVVDSDLTSAYWLLQEAYKSNAINLANTTLDEDDHVTLRSRLEVAQDILVDLSTRLQDDKPTSLPCDGNCKRNRRNALPDPDRVDLDIVVVLVEQALATLVRATALKELYEARDFAAAGKIGKAAACVVHANAALALELPHSRRYEIDAAALDAIDILAANLSTGASSEDVEESAIYAIRHWQAATGLADLGMANETLSFAGTASTGNAALLVMAGDGIDHALTILPPGTVSHDLAVNLADAAAALRAGLPGARAERWRRIDVHELLANVYADVANVMQTDVLVSGRDVGDHGGDLSKIMTPTKSGYA